MNFLKFFAATFILASTSFGSETTSPFEGSISMYNRIKTGSELVDFIFSFDKKHTTEDKKFIVELKENLKNEVMPKASLSGNTILLNNIKIEILSATGGEFLINGKNIKLSPKKPLKITFKEIENALSSKQSKFEFLFLNRAEAAGPLLIIAGAVYGVGAIITGGGCALLGTGFGGMSKETLLKTARVCGELAAAWPYALWSLYDDIKNGNEVIEGSCEKSGPENKFGNLVKLRARDQIGQRYMEESEKKRGLHKKEYYFKTDEKTGKVRVFIKGYDPKNETYDQVYEPESYETLFYNINDQKSGAAAMFSYIKNLESVCANGGTAALNKLIKADPKVSQGLINIGKLDPSRNTKATTGPTPVVAPAAAR